tara:strand:- start:516 stop:956 length:441 start_codon:yes stop_codon:yes gene_type:complete
MEFFLKNENDTIKLGKKIAYISSIGDILCLKGKLGIGKTTLARAIIQSLTNVDKVLSPTYPLMINYQYKNTYIWHFDLYRLKNVNEIWNLGFEDALNDGIIIIEWPEIIENTLPKNKIVVSLFEIEHNQRKAILQANNKFLNKLKK